MSDRICFPAQICMYLFEIVFRNMGTFYCDSHFMFGNLKLDLECSQQFAQRSPVVLQSASFKRLLEKELLI